MRIHREDAQNKRSAFLDFSSRLDLFSHDAAQLLIVCQFVVRGAGKRVTIKFNAAAFMGRPLFIWGGGSCSLSVKIKNWL